MPVQVEGVLYRTLPEVLKELKITRQTLWRWRHEGVIPQGRRFRGRQLIFTEEETDEIRRYANRIEPIESPVMQPQLNLFGAAASGKGPQ
jgi:predicted DNA-binding transcriptional regulator AlpA